MIISLIVFIYFIANINKKFQCAVTVSLNLEEIGKNPERITILSLLSIKITRNEQITHQKKLIGKN